LHILYPEMIGLVRTTYKPPTVTDFISDCIA